MPPIHHTPMAMPLSSSATFLVLIVASFLYVRGWRRMSRASANAITTWRLASFLFGVSF